MLLMPTAGQIVPGWPGTWKLGFSRIDGAETSGYAVIQDLTTSDDVGHANGRLVIFSVHSQTSAINFGSLERGLDLAGLDLTKYSPETCATSGEVARYRDTAAPCFEFSMNGFTTAMISLPMSGGSRSGFQIFVA